MDKYDFTLIDGTLVELAITNGAAHFSAITFTDGWRNASGLFKMKSVPAALLLKNQAGIMTRDEFCASYARNKAATVIARGYAPGSSKANLVKPVPSAEQVRNAQHSARQREDSRRYKHCGQWLPMAQLSGSPEYYRKHDIAK